MNGTQKILLLALAIVAVGCNEQVSPNLQSSTASSGTTTGGTGGTSGSSGSGTTPPVVTPPSTYYFKLSSSADSMLNQKLHKTGIGNNNAECIVGGNTTQLTNDLFSAPATNSLYDISCFYEAEEMTTYLNGISFQVDASANTCEYIGYSPFSYFNAMPGNSTTTYNVVTCTGAVPAGDISGDGTIGAAGIGFTGCNQMRDSSAAVPANLAVPAKLESLCRFDYSATDGAPNCDEGTVTVNKYEVSNDGTTTTIPSTPTVEVIKCGGKVRNCVEGPIKLESEIAKYTKGTVLYQTTLNSSITKKWDLPAPEDRPRRVNFDYVNFRRNLASINLDYGDGTPTSTNPLNYSNAYKSTFINPTYRKEFSPLLLDRYSNNLQPDGVTAVTSFSSINANFTAAPYAAEAYLGASGYRVNPFYTFYCFDRAFDVKARIRMMVRDWDRTFTSSTDQEVISDINSGTSARMDNPTDVEVVGDFDSYNGFNDMADWDDMIPMRVTGPGTTWRPANGLFHPDNFPFVFPEQD